MVGDDQVFKVTEGEPLHRGDAAGQAFGAVVDGGYDGQPRRRNRDRLKFLDLARIDRRGHWVFRRRKSEAAHPHGTTLRTEEREATGKLAVAHPVHQLLVTPQ